MLRPLQVGVRNAAIRSSTRGAAALIGRRTLTTSRVSRLDVKGAGASPVPKADATATPPAIEPTKTAVPVGPAKPAPKSADVIPPPPAPKKKRRFRRFLFTLIALTGLSFAGGVYYSLVSDNFHDFFTEYVPLAEEAVRYIEEREFKKRFPTALSKILPDDADSKVRIGRDSGVTWAVAEKAKAGPHISGTKKGPEPSTVVLTPETPAVQTKVVDEKPLPASSDVVADVKKSSSSKVDKKPRAKSISIPRIDVVESDLPELKALVNQLNTIIEVANKNNSSKDFAPVIASMSEQVNGLRQQISAPGKAVIEGAVSDERLKEIELEYAKLAEVLAEKAQKEVEMAQSLMAVQTMDELQRLAEGYKAKTDKLVGETQEMYEMRLKNAMLEQSKELKRRFAAQIQDVVENERNGRLGKIEQLSGRIQELEELTTAWNNVVNSIIKNQRLQVALDTVKAAIEDPEQPKPFLKELAALKEIAGDDELVRAAISSINPRAYQQGVASPSELVDRFRSVSQEVRKAALLPENAGVAGHAASWVLSKVMFRKSGITSGQDVESILSRTELYLEEGDVNSAAREMNQLTGWAKILARDWLREARILLEVRQAVEVISIEARLRALQAERS